MIELFIAKKYMLDRKKQSIVSIIGIMIGVVVLTVSLGISNGLDKNMIQSVLSISGHILIKKDSPIGNYKELQETIEKYPEVKGVVNNIPMQGIIKIQNSFGEYLSGIKIEGFDLESAGKNMNLTSKIIDGTLDTKPNAIIIGSELCG